MPDIPIESPLSFVGVFFLIFGSFLVLAGSGIIRVERITVTRGARTWIIGFILALIGVGFLFPEIFSMPTPLTTPTAQPPTSTSPPEQSPSPTPTERPDEPPSSPVVFTFDGTINFDMPTPSPPVPDHEFTLVNDGTVDVAFEISPPQADCGLWWRIDSVDNVTHFFGGHVLNTGSHTQSVPLPANDYRLKVGASISDPSCTGTQTYRLTVRVQ